MPPEIEPTPSCETPVAPWVILIDRWKFLFGATFLALLLSVGVALLWPKTYRTTATLVVTPPKYSQELILPPAPLDMKTVETLASAYRTLQRVLTKVLLQRDMVAQVHAALSENAGGQDVWDRLERLSPSKALELLAKDADPLSEEAWSDLPGADVLPGYLEFRERDFEDLDPLVLAESLRTRIQTKLENRIRVEYQPILSLQAEWRTSRTSAIFAHVWAKTFLRLLEEDYLSPTLAVQDKALDLVSRTELDLGQAFSDLASLEIENDHQVLTREREAILRQLDQSKPNRPSLRSEQARLSQEIALLEDRLTHAERGTRVLERDGLWVGFLDSDRISNLQRTLEAVRPQRERLAQMLVELQALGSPHPANASGEEKGSASDRPSKAGEKAAAFLSLLSRLDSSDQAPQTAVLPGSVTPTGTSFPDIGRTIELGQDTLSRWKDLDRTLAAQEDRLSVLGGGPNSLDSGLLTEGSPEVSFPVWAECRLKYLQLRERVLDLSQELSRKRAEQSALERQQVLLSEKEAGLKQRIAPIESRLEDQNRKIASLEEQFAYVLGEAGGSEALGEDYLLTARVHLLEEPVPSKRRLRPQRSVVVLGMGFAAFLFLCSWVIVADQYRRIRRTQSA